MYMWGHGPSGSIDASVWYLVDHQVLSRITQTEQYNGSSWTEVADLGTASSTEGQL